jgi:hypothetical protein
MNLNEIQDLIKFVSKSGVTEVEIEQKLSFRQQQQLRLWQHLHLR